MFQRWRKLMALYLTFLHTRSCGDIRLLSGVAARVRLIFYPFQKGFSWCSCNYGWSWFIKCFLTKLFIIGGSSFFGWYWSGMWACFYIMVSRVCSYSKKRKVDDYFFKFLDCRNNFWGLTCMGMFVVPSLGSLILKYLHKEMLCMSL